MIPDNRREGWNYWEVSNLIKDGILEIGDGYRAKNSEMGEIGLPFARAGNINNGFHFIDADILGGQSVDKAGAKVSCPGDVTFTSKGTFGRFAFVREDTPRFVYSPQLCYWRVKKEGVVDRRFLYYWMQGSDCMNQLNEVKSLTDMADYVSLTNQRMMWLSAPPLSIQSRIAGILSAYDDLIENNQRRIRILEEMARSLYREWFVHFRYPGHETVPLVDSPLGPIPQGWEVHVVEDVLKRIPSGKKYEKKTVNPSGNVPVFDQGKSGIIGYHDDEPGVNASEDKPVIVFANHTCYQRLILYPFSAIQNVLPFLPSPSLHRDIYWLHWATNGLIQFNDYKGHWPEFIAKQLIVPTSDICQKFGEFAAPLARKTLKLEQTIENLRNTRNLLLPKLLSGQIDLIAAHQ